MATDPVVEKIAQAHLTRLQTMSVANGYNFDYTAVVRPLRINSSARPRHLVVTLEQASDPEPVPEHSIVRGSTFVQAWRVTWNSSVFVGPTESSATPIDQWLNQIAADLRKALSVSGTADFWTWGGRALPPPRDGDGQPIGAEEFWGFADGSFIGVTLPTTVWFRTPEGDPYTAVT